MIKDWNGKEIKVGDRVRHAYQPWPGGKSDGVPQGKGYHCHNFHGDGVVVSIGSTTAIIKASVGGEHVHLGSLIEILDDSFVATTPYLITVTGPYREPSIRP